MKKLPSKSTSTTENNLSSAEKLTLAARLARGEYRMEAGEIEMLQAECCTAVRAGLSLVCPTQGQVAAHQSLRKDLGISEKAFESVRNQISKQVGFEFPEALSESLTVWDCYDKADQQFKSIDTIHRPNVRSGDIP